MWIVRHDLANECARILNHDCLGINLILHRLVGVISLAPAGKSRPLLDYMANGLAGFLLAVDVQNDLAISS